MTDCSRSFVGRSSSPGSAEDAQEQQCYWLPHLASIRKTYSSITDSGLLSIVMKLEEKNVVALIGKVADNSMREECRKRVEDSTPVE